MASSSATIRVSLGAAAAVRLQACHPFLPPPFPPSVTFINFIQRPPVQSCPPPPPPPCPLPPPSSSVPSTTALPPRWLATASSPPPRAAPGGRLWRGRLYRSRRDTRGGCRRLCRLRLVPAACPWSRRPRLATRRGRARPCGPPRRYSSPATGRAGRAAAAVAGTAGGCRAPARHRHHHRLRRHCCCCRDGGRRRRGPPSAVRGRRPVVAVRGARVHGGAGGRNGGCDRAHGGRPGRDCPGSSM